MVENAKPSIHFIDFSSDLFKICEDGCVFKFFKKISQNDANFGSDSSYSERSSWKKVSEPLGRIVKPAGNQIFPFLWILNCIFIFSNVHRVCGNCKHRGIFLLTAVYHDSRFS